MYSVGDRVKFVGPSGSEYGPSDPNIVGVIQEVDNRATLLPYYVKWKNRLRWCFEDDIVLASANEEIIITTQSYV